MNSNQPSSSSSRSGTQPGSTMNEFRYKYCRLCAVELKCGVFIYGEEGRRLQLPEKIRKSLSILVFEEDDLPKKICTDCCSSLEDYAKYKDTVLEAQEKLAAIAQKCNYSSGSGSQPNALSNSSIQEENVISSSSTIAVSPEKTSSQNPIVLSSPLSHQRCKFCGKRFVTKIALDTHLNSEHSDIYSAPRVVEEVEEPIEIHIPSPTPSVSRDFEGPVEEEPQAHSSNVMDSKSVPNSKTGPVIAESSKPIKKRISSYQCPTCNKQLNSVGGYYSHLNTHKGRRFFCSSCPSSYTQKPSLQAHVKSVHTASSSIPSPPPPKHKCPMCPKLIANSKRLTQHIKTHTTARPFECKICKKSFKTNKCLIQHMTRHNPQKSYECSFCPKRFTSSDKLTYHKNCHLDLRPYGCPFCERTFNGHSNYSKHVKRMHPTQLGPGGKVPEVLRKDKKVESVNMPVVKHLQPPNQQATQGLIETSSQNYIANNHSQTTTSMIVTATTSSYIPVSTTVAPPTNSRAQSENQNSWSGNSHIDPIQSGSGSRNHGSLHNHQLNNREHNPIPLQPQPNVQIQHSQQTNQSQHHSIPIVPMDDMMDCAIQSALLSHSQTGESSGNDHSSSVQSYNQHQVHPRQSINGNHLQSSSGAGSSSQTNSQQSYHDLPQNDINKVMYMTHFDETPLELCVRSNSEDNSEENFSQLVDLTSAKIVDLSGVGLVVAAAASSASHNSHSQGTSSNSTSSMMYRSQGQQMSTMTMVQMPMMPMDLTDQQQDPNMISNGNMGNHHNNHNTLTMTSSGSSNNHNHGSDNLMNNLVDLSYTGNNNNGRGTTSQFQVQSQQDDNMMSTSSFFRELLDLSCSTSTTRGVPSTSTTMDSYSHHQQLPQQNHYQQQQANYHPQQQQYQHQNHTSDQIQQYELNLSSKSKVFGSTGHYQQTHGHTGHSSSMAQSSQNHNTNNMYQPTQSNSSGSILHNPQPQRSMTTANNTTTSNSTNQYHGVVYNENLFM